MSLVTFQNADVAFLVKNKRNLRTTLINLCRTEQKQLETLSYILCSDEFLLTLNQQYLNHDTLTDVITFDLSASANLIVGEVYISVDRVKENAAELQLTVQQELYRVMIHGLLHLCGYGDKKKSEITIMREKEDYYLRLLTQT